MARYWTPEFTEIYTGALSRDSLFQRLTQDFHQRIQLRCWDDPDGQDQLIEYDINRGNVEGKATTGPAPFAEVRNLQFDPKLALARTSAPYEIWVKLDKKEMGVIDAIISPHYKFEGPKLKVLRYIRIFNRMGEIAASLSKTY